ncbi:MAG: hypothetical protein K1000chlam3_00136 [Chlamydiae bacterium]|nr:hypothetical protein [Chlamydiota bacterium]
MNPRNKRLLEVLVIRDRVFVNELRKLIGAFNPAQNAHELRRAGWKINTGRGVAKDRDGKTCRPGFYWMEPHEQARVIEFLKGADRAAGTAPSANDNPELHNSESPDTIDDSIGGKNDNLLS